MKVLKSVWFGIALALTLFALACIATPHMHIIILWNKIRGRDGFMRRDRLYLWCMWWSDIEWFIFSKLMRIETHYDLPKRDDAPHPAVVISNHRSSVDVVLLPILLRRMGFRRITGVVKAEVKKFPIIGRSTKEIRSAYVERSNDPEDLTRIRVCAENAKDDGACIMIFPEGTILACGRSRGDFTHVSVPKTKGLSAIRDVVPDWPVLSVTLDWGDIPGASSIYTAWTMFGGSITLRARYVDNVTGRPLEEWLTEEWERKERELANSALRTDGHKPLSAD